MKLIRKVSSYMVCVPILHNYCFFFCFDQPPQHRYFVPEYNKADVFLVSLARWQALCVVGLEARLLAGVARAVAADQARGAPDTDDLLAGLVRAFADVRVAERVPAARLADPQHEQLEASHAARILQQIKTLKLTGHPETDWPRLAEVLSRLPDDDLVQRLMQDNSASLVAASVGAHVAAQNSLNSSTGPASMIDLSMRP